MKSLLFVFFALSACKHTTPAPQLATLLAPERPEATQAEEQPSFDIEISCDDVSNTPNQTFTVDGLAGETVSIRICARAGTGYEWLEVDVDETYLTRKVWQFTTPPDNPMLGGSGWRDAVYEIKKGGDTTFMLEYRRQWVEDDVIAAIRFLIQTPEK